MGMKKRVLFVIPARDGKTLSPLMSNGSAPVVAGFTVKAAKLLDLQVECMIHDEHVEGAVQLKHLAQCDLMVDTHLTPSRIRAFEVADMARSAGVPTITGGMDVTTMHIDNAHEPLLERFDAIWAGHLTTNGWARAMESWLNGRLDLIYQAGADEPPYEFVDPEWSLMNLGVYFFTAFQSSVGCCYRCPFCSVGAIAGWGKFHLKPIPILEREIEHILSTGRKFLVDSSDSFGVNTRHYADCVIPLLKKTRVAWATEATAMVLGGPDGESGLLDQMYESGCRLVYIGAESLTKKLPKNPPWLLKRLIERCNKLGVMVLVSLVLDCEADATFESVKWTIEELLSWGAHVFQVSLSAAFHGTDIRAEAIRDGRLILPEDPRNYDGLHATLVHNASPEERSEWLKWCWNRVYSPWNKARLLAHVALHQPAMRPLVVDAFHRIRAGVQARV